MIAPPFLHCFNRLYEPISEDGNGFENFFSIDSQIPCRKPESPSFFLCFS